MLKEFKDFINRGNVVDLAVAVVLGAAFGAVVTSFVDDILMNVIAAISPIVAGGNPVRAESPISSGSKPWPAPHRPRGPR